jgi:hypothetical protein
VDGLDSLSRPRTTSNPAERGAGDLRPRGHRAAAMGISETFNVLRGRPGNDAGHRPVSLNLWNPGQSDGDGPVLRYAPVQWWLVWLGHLGQAYSWGLSWLDYAEPSLVQVVLQDTDRTTPPTTAPASSPRPARPTYPKRA